MWNVSIFGGEWVGTYETAWDAIHAERELVDQGESTENIEIFFEDE